MLCPPLSVAYALNVLQYGNSPFNQGRVTIAIEQGYHIEIHLAVTLLGASPFRIPASVLQYDRSYRSLDLPLLATAPQFPVNLHLW